MRKMFVCLALIACAPLTACFGGATAAPTTIGAQAPPEVTPEVRASVSDRAIRFSFASLATVAGAADLLVAFGKLKPGSPEALRTASALEGTLKWLNLASSLQRAGRSSEAAAAWDQAEAGLAGLRTALGIKE